ncbi:MAG: class I tRNA ligase family protein, partial [Haloferacaceae archaeon]
YVWVDAPIEYVSSTKQYSERVGSDAYDWTDVWSPDSEVPADPDDRIGGGEIVHVIGRDIIQHHTVFWPAMLRGAGYAEPRAVLASGFITLDGAGFSTSRDRAVWADEYLDEGFHPDPLRYYLVSYGAFQQDVDFSWAKFRERTNNELVGTLGNFLYRSLLFAHRNYGGTPEADPTEEVTERIETAVAEFRAGVNDYSVRAVARAATRLAQFGNEYIQREEPWRLVDDDPERAARVIRGCVQVAKAVLVLFFPVAPDRCATVWDRLNEDGSLAEATVADALDPPASEFDEPVEPFETVEEETVAALNERLEERTADAEAETDEADETDETDEADAPENLEPLVHDRVSFDDFQALDLRVGRILEAEGIDGADDLARLVVDIGLEERQVVAGIKQLHDLDALPGSTVVVAANIEKAELFGVESDGMVLAAGEEADLLTTHGDAEPGERVR